LSAHIIFSELTDDYEILHLEILKYEDKPRNVIGIYRPPSGKFEPFILAIESLLMRNNEQLVILGDINLNTNINSVLSSHSNDYVNLLDNFNYCIYNQAITRYNKVTHKHSVIDHVISQKNRKDFMTLTTNNIITESFSDHQLIMVKEFGNSSRGHKIMSPTIFEKVNKKKVILEITKKINTVPINIHPTKLCDGITEFIKTVISNNTSKITLKFMDKNETVPQWIDMNYINYYYYYYYDYYLFCISIYMPDHCHGFITL